MVKFTAVYETALFVHYVIVKIPNNPTIFLKASAKLMPFVKKDTLHWIIEFYFYGKIKQLKDVFLFFKLKHLILYFKLLLRTSFNFKIDNIICYYCYCYYYIP